jgi:hypothetical protein
MCGTGSCQQGICCAAGQTNCGGTCTNLLTDPNNCDVCGNVCPGTPGVCTNGSCCGAGLISCKSQCVNPQTDPQNCGGCFNQCASGQSCTNGGCCTTGLLFCGGACVNANNDANNCGGCGNVCTGGALCLNGSCGCPTYESYCGPTGSKTCIPTAVDPFNCGGCNVVCPSGVCSNSKCYSGCGLDLSACPVPGAFAQACYDTSADYLHCGGCGACGPGLGCNNGSCIAPVVPFYQNPGGICGANGIGPELSFTDGTTSTCSGIIGATSFTFGVCACASLQTTGSSNIDAFDSTQGPYGSTINPAGQLGGSLGINANFDSNSSMTVSGDVVGFGDVTFAGTTTIKQELHVNGVQSASFTAGGLAEIRTPAGSGTIGANASFPDHNLYTTVACPAAGYTEQNGGKCIDGSPPPGPPPQPFSVQEPCKRCDAGEQVPIAGYIAYYKTHNNNALLTPPVGGLATNAMANLSGAAVLDLPCGIYYLDSIHESANVDVTIVAHGNTALFVAGDISVRGGMVIEPESADTHFDLFVGGSININGAPRIGNTAFPSNMRIYVGSPCGGAGATCASGYDCCSGNCSAANTCTGAGALDWSLTFGNAKHMAADFYMPNGAFNPTTNFTGLEGAIFAHDYVQNMGSLGITYDKAGAGQANECPPPNPPGGCASCLDCANQACNIPSGQTLGTCGGCTNDGQCCSPLRCVIQSGQPTGTCQFTFY